MGFKKPGSKTSRASILKAEFFRVGFYKSSLETSFFHSVSAYKW